MTYLLDRYIYYFSWRFRLFNILHLPNRFYHKSFFDVIMRPRIFLFSFIIRRQKLSAYSNWFCRFFQYWSFKNGRIINADSQLWNPCIFHFISSYFYGVSSFRIPFRFHKLWKHLLHESIFLYSFFSNIAPQKTMTESQPSNM